MNKIKLEEEISKKVEKLVEKEWNDFIISIHNNKFGKNLLFIINDKEYMLYHGYHSSSSIFKYKMLENNNENNIIKTNFNECLKKVREEITSEIIEKILSKADFDNKINEILKENNLDNFPF